MLMCLDIIFSIFPVLGFVEFLESKMITITPCFLQREARMSTSLADEMNTFLNDGTQGLTLLNKDQFIPKCFTVVLSLGQGSHKPPASYKNLVAEQRKSLQHVF